LTLFVIFEILGKKEKNNNNYNKTLQETHQEIR